MWDHFTLLYSCWALAPCYPTPTPSLLRTYKLINHIANTTTMQNSGLLAQQGQPGCRTPAAASSSSRATRPARRTVAAAAAAREVTLLDYGAGNVRSVRNAIKKLGYSIKDVSYTRKPPAAAAATAASRVVASHPHPAACPKPSRAAKLWINLCMFCRWRSRRTSQQQTS